MTAPSKALLLSFVAVGLAACSAPARSAQNVSSPAQATGAAPAESSGNPLPAGAQPAAVRTVLYKMYDDAYKIGGAVTTLHPEHWKVPGRKRAVFNRAGAALQSAISDFRMPWNGFYASPRDASQGKATLEALKGLEAKVSDFMTALSGSPGADQAGTYQRYAADLTLLGGELNSYVTSLAAPAEAAVAPPAPAENPAAPASQPSTNASEAPAPPAETPAPAEPKAQAAPEPVAMSAQDARALLYKIYSASYRIADLTSSLQTGNWSISADQRSAIDQKSQALRGAVTTFETTWKGFYEQPAIAELGQTTDTQLRALLSEANAFSSSLANTPGAGAAQEYQKATTELAGLEGRLGPYVAYLTAKEQPPGRGRAAISTEVIQPAAAAAPLSGAATEQLPLNEQELKGLMYKAYVPAFRLRDLLKQEHPESWKLSEAERTAYGESSEMLSKDLADLAKWRGELEDHPRSLEAAFEVYALLGKIGPPADSVSGIVARHDSAALGAEYARRALEVAELRSQLEPYLGYLLRVYDEQAGTVQQNFNACEQELGFAMRPSRPAAVPMKNIVPVFKGRRRSRAPNHSEKSRGHESHKTDPDHSKHTVTNH
jgi:hypothetical protein